MHQSPAGPPTRLAQGTPTSSGAIPTLALHTLYVSRTQEVCRWVCLHLELADIASTDNFTLLWVFYGWLGLSTTGVFSTTSLLVTQMGRPGGRWQDGRRWRRGVRG